MLSVLNWNVQLEKWKTFKWRDNLYKPALQCHQACCWMMEWDIELLEIKCLKSSQLNQQVLLFQGKNDAHFQSIYLWLLKAMTFLCFLATYARWKIDYELPFKQKIAIRWFEKVKTILQHSAIYFKVEKQTINQCACLMSFRWKMIYCDIYFLSSSAACLLNVYFLGKNSQKLQWNVTFRSQLGSKCPCRALFSIKFWIKDHEYQLWGLTRISNI